MQQETALVSGASGNLGNAVKEYFLSQGRAVAGLVHKTANEDTHPKNYFEFAVDLTKEDEAAKVFSDSLAQLQRIDTAILTTGGFTMGNLENTSTEDIRKQFSLNFETAYNLARPIIKEMKKEKQGTLFFIGSGQGMNTAKGAGAVAYSLSKSLLFQLANIINAEVANTSIRVFVVVPHIIDTPQNRKSMPDADFSQWQKPEDIAAVIGRYAKYPSCAPKTEIVLREEL